MKQLWLAFGSCVLLTVIVFVFFWLSLPVKNNIQFTDLPKISGPQVTFIDPVQGDSQAKVTIVLYGEYGCASCATTEANIHNLLNDKKLDVRYVWKDLTLEADHAAAFAAAMAAKCALKQKKFWEFHDALMAGGNQFMTGNFDALVKSVGLEQGAFGTCMSSRAAAPLVERDVLEAEALNVAATPTVFVNEERVTGLTSEADLRAMVGRAIIRQ